ncbi:methyltransferase domain-containing protein, partial [bacterium]
YNPIISALRHVEREQLIWLIATEGQPWGKDENFVYYRYNIPFRQWREQLNLSELYLQVSKESKAAINIFDRLPHSEETLDRQRIGVMGNLTPEQYEQLVAAVNERAVGITEIDAFNQFRIKTGDKPVKFCRLVFKPGSPPRENFPKRFAFAMQKGQVLQVIMSGEEEERFSGLFKNDLPRSLQALALHEAAELKTGSHKVAQESTKADYPDICTIFKYEELGNLIKIAQELEEDPQACVYWRQAIAICLDDSLWQEFRGWPGRTKLAQGDQRRILYWVVEFLRSSGVNSIFALLPIGFLFEEIESCRQSYVETFKRIDISLDSAKVIFGLMEEEGSRSSREDIVKALNAEIERLNTTSYLARLLNELVRRLKLKTPTELERRVLAALAEAGYVVSRAAANMDVSEPAFRRYMRRYGITPESARTTGQPQEKYVYVRKRPGSLKREWVPVAKLKTKLSEALARANFVIGKAARKRGIGRDEFARQMELCGITSESAAAEQLSGGFVRLGLDNRRVPLESLKKELLKYLTRVRGNITKAAKMKGVSWITFVNYMKACGIDPKQCRPEPKAASRKSAPSRRKDESGSYPSGFGAGTWAWDPDKACETSAIEPRNGPHAVGDGSRLKAEAYAKTFKKTKSAGRKTPIEIFSAQILNPQTLDAKKGESPLYKTAYWGVSGPKWDRLVIEHKNLIVRTKLSKNKRKLEFGGKSWGVFAEFKVEEIEACFENGVLLWVESINTAKRKYLSLIVDYASQKIVGSFKEISKKELKRFGHVMIKKKFLDGHGKFTLGSRRTWTQFRDYPKTETEAEVLNGVVVEIRLIKDQDGRPIDEQPRQLALIYDKDGKVLLDAYDYMTKTKLKSLKDNVIKKVKLEESGVLKLMGFVAQFKEYGGHPVEMIVKNAIVVAVRIFNMEATEVLDYKELNLIYDVKTKKIIGSFQNVTQDVLLAGKKICLIGPTVRLNKKGGFREHWHVSGNHPFARAGVYIKNGEVVKIDLLQEDSDEIILTKLFATKLRKTRGIVTKSLLLKVMRRARKLIAAYKTSENISCADCEDRLRRLYEVWEFFSLIASEQITRYLGPEATGKIALLMNQLKERIADTFREYREKFSSDDNLLKIREFLETIELDVDFCLRKTELLRSMREGRESVVKDPQEAARKLRRALALLGAIPVKCFPAAKTQDATITCAQVKASYRRRINNLLFLAETYIYIYRGIDELREENPRLALATFRKAKSLLSKINPASENDGAIRKSAARLRQQIEKLIKVSERRLKEEGLFRTLVRLQDASTGHRKGGGSPIEGSDANPELAERQTEYSDKAGVAYRRILGWWPYRQQLKEECGWRGIFALILSDINIILAFIRQYHLRAGPKIFKSEPIAWFDEVERVIKFSPAFKKLSLKYQSAIQSHEQVHAAEKGEVEAYKQEIRSLQQHRGKGYFASYILDIFTARLQSNHPRLKQYIWWLKAMALVLFAFLAGVVFVTLLIPILLSVAVAVFRSTISFIARNITLDILFCAILVLLSVHLKLNKKFSKIKAAVLARGYFAKEEERYFIKAIIVFAAPCLSMMVSALLFQSVVSEGIIFSGLMLAAYAVFWYLRLELFDKKLKARISQDEQKVMNEVERLGKDPANPEYYLSLDDNQEVNKAIKETQAFLLNNIDVKNELQAKGVKFVRAPPGWQLGAAIWQDRASAEYYIILPESSSLEVIEHEIRAVLLGITHEENMQLEGAVEQLPEVVKDSLRRIKRGEKLRVKDWSAIKLNGQPALSEDEARRCLEEQWGMFRKYTEHVLGFAIETKIVLKFTKIESAEKMRYLAIGEAEDEIDEFTMDLSKISSLEELKSLWWRIAAKTYSEVWKWLCGELERIGEDVIAHWIETYPSALQEAVFHKEMPNWNINANDRILDAGTGLGPFAIEMAKSAKEVEAIDILDKVLDIGRQRAQEQGLTNIKFTHTDMLDLSLFQDNSFEKVVFGWSLDLLPAPLRILACEEALRVLKDKGDIIILAVYH